MVNPPSLLPWLWIEVQALSMHQKCTSFCGIRSVTPTHPQAVKIRGNDVFSGTWNKKGEWVSAKARPCPYLPFGPSPPTTPPNSHLPLGARAPMRAPALGSISGGAGLLACRRTMGMRAGACVQRGGGVHMWVPWRVRKGRAEGYWNGTPNSHQLA